MELSSPLLDTGEAARFLRLSVSTIRGWTHLRRIPHVKLGGRVLFKKEDLEKLIETSRRGASATE